MIKSSWEMGHTVILLFTGIPCFNGVIGHLHTWKLCISYWKWRFSNIILVFQGSVPFFSPKHHISTHLPQPTPSPRNLGGRILNGLFRDFPHGVLPPTWLQHSPVLQRRPAKRISCEHPASPKRGKGPSIICYVASLSPQKEMKWIIFQIIHFQIPIMRIAYEDSSRWWLNPSEPCL